MSESSQCYDGFYMFIITYGQRTGRTACGPLQKKSTGETTRWCSSSNAIHRRKEGWWKKKKKKKMMMSHHQLERPCNWSGFGSCKGRKYWTELSARPTKLRAYYIFIYPSQQNIFKFWIFIFYFFFYYHEAVAEQVTDGKYKLHVAEHE